MTYPQFKEAFPEEFAKICAFCEQENLELSTLAVKVLNNSRFFKRAEVKLADTKDSVQQLVQHVEDATSVQSKQQEAAQ